MPTNWWLTPQAGEVQEQIAKDLLGWSTIEKGWLRFWINEAGRRIQVTDGLPDPLDWHFVGACLEVLVERDWFFSKVSGDVVTGELYAEARDYLRIDAPDLKSAILEAAKVEAKA